MALSLASCGESSGGTESTATETVSAEDTKNYIFSETDAGITGYDGEVEGAVRNGDNIYFATYEWIEDAAESSDNMATDSDAAEPSDDMATGSDAAESDSDELSGRSVTRLYVAPTEGGTATEVGEADSYTGRMFACGDGVMVISTTYDDVTGEQSRSGIIYSADGTEQTIDLAFIEAEGDDYINTTVVDGDGDLVVCYSRSVKVYSLDGKEKCVYDSKNYLNTLVVTRDGGVLVAEDSSEGGVIFKLLDKASGSCGEAMNVTLSNFSSDSLITGAGKYDFCYESGTDLYGYSVEDGGATKLLDYTASSINIADTISRIMLSDTELILVSYDDDIGGYTFEKCEKVDPSDVKDKITLKLATLYGDEELKSDVVKFNKKNTKYSIELLDYSSEEDPQAKLAADIAAGSIPDMYELSAGTIGDITIEQAASKGMLENLLPYIEADEELSIDDFLPAVTKRLYIGDELYYMPYQVSMSSIVARRSDIGDIEGWTFTEMMDYLSTKNLEEQKIMRHASKFWIFYYFMRYSMSDFIDWDSGTCSFDSDDFKAFLELCNTGTESDEEYEGEEESVYEMIQNGSLIFEYVDVSPNSMPLYNQMFDGDIAYIGYPNSERCGTVATASGGVAISSQCTDKDGAWQFVRQYLTREYQGKIYYGNTYAIPTRQDIFEMYLTMCQATEKYTDEFGNEVYPLDGAMSVDDNIYVEAGPMSDEDIEVLRNIVNHIGTIQSYDANVAQIINEEAEPYFNGDKTVDEVCELIQNRVQTYVSENK